MVVLIFLQDWRATLMPMIDVPVSLIGTFAVMALLGLFAEQSDACSAWCWPSALWWMTPSWWWRTSSAGWPRGCRRARRRSRPWTRSPGRSFRITLVLCAVFVPTVFLAGITGQFYSQFALTIAVSTVISAINSMTMAPARAVTLDQTAFR